MPRNGSGIYSLPAGSTVTNGDLSDATDVNTPLADIEADLNVARPVATGGTGATNAADARTNLGVTLAGLGAQAADPTLTALAAYNTNGLLTQTAADTFTGRTITAGTGITVTNGNGVAGNPTVAAAGNLASLAGLSLVAGDVLYATGANTLVRLGIGTAGQVLQVNGGATAPQWATPASPAGHVLLGTITTTSGTSQTLGSLTLTGYSFLLLVVNGVSMDTANARMALSSTVGPQCSAQISAVAGVLHGEIRIELNTGVFGSTVTASDNTGSVPRGGISTITTASTSVTVATNLGTFDAGTIRVYGVL